MSQDRDYSGIPHITPYKACAKRETGRRHAYSIQRCKLHQRHPMERMGGRGSLHNIVSIDLSNDRSDAAADRPLDSKIQEEIGLAA